MMSSVADDDLDEDTDAAGTARRTDRTRAWDWTRAVAADGNIWRLEALRALLERAEGQPGSMPQFDKPPAGAVRSQLAFTLGALAGLLLLALWLLRPRGPGRLPPGARRVVALHGELSTRTRHVLSALPEADPPVEAIVLLGRLRLDAPRIERLWLDAGLGPVPLAVPVSPRAALAALADLPRLWHAGWRAARQGPGPLRVATWVSIGFRVWHGAVMARWWAAQAVPAGCEVVLGISGTADTTLLERAIRAGGGRSVHAVHGQSVGPNFLGFSDLALFRSRHDATAMAGCGNYGRSDIQPAAPVAPRRGGSGLLVLTNLAHPMNPDFRRHGPVDELAVLEAAAGAARLLGGAAEPLIWKPHPVIARLPPAQTAALRTRAAALGWTEVPPDASAVAAGAVACWVICTPSTAALDLLQAGILCVMVDPRGTLLDTAPSLLPVAPCTAEGLAAVLEALRDPAAHSAHFSAAWDAVGPARPLDFTTPLV